MTRLGARPKGTQDGALGPDLEAPAPAALHSPSVLWRPLLLAVGSAEPFGG